MRKIIIPTDFSENAMNAIQFAVELFKYERSEFLLVHAYADEVYDHDTLVSREVFGKLKASVLKYSDTELENILDQIQKISPNPKHQYKKLSAFGTLVDEINDLVDLENIDIVVMGTRGKTDDRTLTFGSNTLQVLKYIKCPVLAIPATCRYKQPTHILFPTDYRFPYKRRELKLVNTMAQSFRSTITTMYLSNFTTLSIRQEDNKAFLTACLPDATLAFKTLSANDLTTAINEYVLNHSIDMLVMINSRHSYVENMLYQSTIDKIGLHITIPFLILQNLNR
ncbi:universal stress protein [Aquimarina addita]|uniref:Universal stress protein n=1 Tax=Aquimarina addita TaxID=870485 RepID=A0ABP7XDC6_9FLAO